MLSINPFGIHLRGITLVMVEDKNYQNVAENVATYVQLEPYLPGTIWLTHRS